MGTTCIFYFVINRLTATQIEIFRSDLICFLFHVIESNLQSSVLYIGVCIYYTIYKVFSAYIPYLCKINIAASPCTG